jgi:hypothetical protein
MVCVFGARNESELRDGCDRSKRLAAKAHRVDGLELFERADFARGMTRERQCELVLLDATPVIDHRYTSDSASFESNLNRLRARIDGVFHQFFENGSGSFDHFASGDLTHEQVG